VRTLIGPVRGLTPVPFKKHSPHTEILLLESVADTKSVCVTLCCHSHTGSVCNTERGKERLY
jgi:hypothetical protein